MADCVKNSKIFVLFASVITILQTYPREIIPNVVKALWTEMRIATMKNKKEVKYKISGIFSVFPPEFQFKELEKLRRQFVS